MSNDQPNAIPRRSKWVRITLFSIVGIALTGAVAGGWMLYTCVAVSLEAERNLTLVNFAIGLVEQSVRENGRWPRSWQDLEHVNALRDAPYPFGGRWPDKANDLQQHVRIDFEADPKLIIQQDPMEFRAVQPVGPCFVYQGDRPVDSLIETLKRQSESNTPHPRPLSRSGRGESLLHRR